MWQAAGERDRAADEAVGPVREERAESAVPASARRFSSLAAAVALASLMLIPDGASAQQMVIRELIAPRTGTVTVDEVFRIEAGDSKGEPAHPLAAAPDSRPQVHARQELDTADAPFGAQAAYIPFWQLAGLFREIRPVRRAEADPGTAGSVHGALVGGGSVYLPPMMTETEKAVCLAIIQHLRESRALSDDIRIGVSLYEVPDILLQPRRVLDGDTGLRVEPVTPLRRSPRFALYLDGPHPVAVVRADLEFYRPGYVAARELTGGVLLHPEDVKTAAVRISHEELERRAGQSAGATGARAFSLSGYSSGYRYRLRGGLAAGEPILGRNVESIAPVEGGDEVVASFERSGISLTIPGRALSSGGIGEVVTVRLSTGKKTKLRVTGHRRVASPRPHPRKVTLHE